MSNTPDTRHDSVTSNVVRLKNNRTEIRPLRDCRALPPPGVTESFRVIPLPVLKNKKKNRYTWHPGGKCAATAVSNKKIKKYIRICHMGVLCTRCCTTAERRYFSLGINKQSIVPFLICFDNTDEIRKSVLNFLPWMRTASFYSFGGGEGRVRVRISSDCVTFTPDFYD